MNSTVAAEWASEAHARSAVPWPDPVTASAAGALLDYLGLACGGAPSAITTAVARAHSAPAQADSSAAGGAMAIGHGRWPDPVAAAGINATAGHVLDLDDGHKLAAGHPGTVVIPAALAASELSGADGRRLLSAVVLGYQVFVKLGSAMNPEHLRRGFHTTATVGAVAAGMAAAVAGKLDVQGISDSVSLAALMGAGLMEVTVSGGDAKPIQVGRAAGAGMLAARLAAQGIGGPEKAIEGEYGLIRAGTGLTPDHDSLVLKDEKWAIGERYVKVHAACRHTHAAIDAALNIRERLSSADIAGAESVIVDTYAAAESICGSPARPESVADARFSLPFTVALGLIAGSVGPRALTERSLGNAEVLALAEKVRVRVDPELEALYPERRGAGLSVRMADGREVSERVLVPHGEPENALDDTELVTKFAEVCEMGGLPEEAAMKLRERVGELAELERAADLLEPLEGWIPGADRSKHQKNRMLG